MSSLLTINATANWGSTGKIAEQINQLAQKRGWETYLAYGRNVQPCKSKLIHVGNMLQVYEHYAEHRLFDNDGLASRLSTLKLVREIKRIKPDIIHLHNIHDHWLNYKILFEYLNTLEIPIVWTQHDCWAFTGGCKHFTRLKCNQWVTGCTTDCSFRRGINLRKYISHSANHYQLKQRLFTNTKNLTLVPVSHWLEGVLKESFLKDRSIRTICNGVDVDVFKPTDNFNLILKRYGLENTKYVIGVATAWSGRKGFNDYCRLTSMLPTDLKIVLVGLNENMMMTAERHGIIGIPRTESVEELVALYNGASIVMNLSYEETFGLTTVEGFACGTPSIVYNATASPELVTPETGIVCEPGDIDGVAKAVEELLSLEKPVVACRNRAIKYYSKNDCFKEYVDLYENLLGKN